MYSGGSACTVEVVLVLRTVSTYIHAFSILQGLVQLSLPTCTAEAVRLSWGIATTTPTRTATAPNTLTMLGFGVLVRMCALCVCTCDFWWYRCVQLMLFVQISTILCSFSFVLVACILLFVNVRWTG